MSGAGLILIEPASGMAAVVILAVSCIVLPQTDRTTAAIALTGSLAIAGFVFLLQMDVYSVWAAVRTDAAIQTGFAEILAARIFSIHSNGAGMAIASIAGIWALEQYRKDDPKNPRIRLSIIGAAGLALAAILFIAEKPNDTPLLLLVLLLYLHRSISSIQVAVTSISEETYKLLRYMATAAPFLFFSAALIAVQAINIAAHTAESAKTEKGYWEGAAADAALLKPVIDLPTGLGKQRDGYAAVLLEAMALVREHDRQATRILLFDEVNPLPYLFQSPPPQTILGSAIAVYLTAHTHHPGAGAILRDADTLIIPRERIFGQVSAILYQTYESDILRCFSQASGSEHFSIWFRNPSCVF